jgi:hypothetical protein
LKENYKQENNISNPNLLISFLELISGKWFVFLGVILMLFSSYPVIKEMSSTSLVYLILLTYSTGLFGSGYFIRKSLPWTGDVFYIITLLATPVILASATSLNFSTQTDFIITGVTLLIVPATSYIILKTLYKELKLNYFIVFILLALSSSLPRYLENPFYNLGFLREDFETFIVFLFFALISAGSFFLAKSLTINKESNNLKQTFLLNLLLVFVYFIIVSTNNVSLPAYGLIMMFMASLLLFNVKKLKNILNDQHLSKNKFITVKNLATTGFILSALSPVLAFNDLTKLVLVTFSGFILYISVWNLFSFKSYKFLNQSLNGIFYISFMIYLLKSWSLSSDIQSLMISGITLLLVFAGNIKDFKNAKSTLYFISLTTSVIVWVKISIFDSWSVNTILSLFILSFIYLMNSLYHKRNVLSYISVVTFTIASFSLITVVNPYINFYYYRYFAVLFSFLYLSVGYLVQLRYSNHKTAKLLKEPEKPGINLAKDFIRPFNFQDRFVSLFPYLISEPLYNLALLMTSISVLVNFKDYTIAIPAALFYICVFKIYPSRLWIYFALTAATDGFLNIITNVLPAKYQGWGFIFLSFNWFFIGVIVEELFEAYERKGRNFVHIDKKYAQPFFQGALIVNIFLLKYFFIDLINVNSQQGWLKLEQELFQIMIISLLYLLKMRAYISKLWLFPCIGVASLVIFFKSISLLGAEYTLLIMTFISFLWLAAGTFFNRSQKCVEYVKSIVVHKLPNININSKYYRNHIYDFASPFYIFSFLCASVSLFISALLIPKYAVSFARSLEFGFSQLNISNLNTFYFVQILNFVLIAVFFTIFYPKRILLLDGNYQETKFPKSIKILPVTSITLNFFWIYNFLLTFNDIAIFISGTALIWTVFYGLSVFLQREKKEPGLKVNIYYFSISIFLGSVGFLLTSFYALNKINHQLINPSFAFLIATFTLLFAITRVSFLIYFIEASLFAFFTFFFSPVYWFETIYTIYAFAFINFALLILTNRFQNKFSDRFNELTNILAFAFPFFISYIDNRFHTVEYFSLAGFTFYFLRSLYDQSRIYPVLSFLMLGISFYYYSTSLYTYNFAFFAVASCYIFYGFTLKLHNIQFDKFKQSMIIFSASLPLFILSNWYFGEFTRRCIRDYENYPSATYFLILVVSSFFIYPFIAHTIKIHRLKMLFWWITAIFANLLEIPLFNLLNLFSIGINMPQLIITSIGISFLLLSRIGSDNNYKNDCIYIGQFFLLIYPYFIYKFGYNNFYYYSENIKYIFLFQFSLYLILIAFLIYLSFKCHRKAYLYFNLFVISFLLLTEIPYAFINGDWLVKWGMLLSFGAITTFSGIQIETKKELIKNKISEISNTLKEWD